MVPTSWSGSCKGTNVSVREVPYGPVFQESRVVERGGWRRDAVVEAVNAPRGISATEVTEKRHVSQWEEGRRNDVDRVVESERVSLWVSGPRWFIKTWNGTRVVE